jgi:hypothetical protein
MAPTMGPPCRLNITIKKASHATGFCSWATGILFDGQDLAGIGRANGLNLVTVSEQHQIT